jgi:hypothetical protein
MSKRALSVSILTAGLSAGLLAGAISPAAAQGNPVGGSGSLYFLSGAMNTSGQAEKITHFGDPGDEVFFGDWYGTDEDMPMVRRGNLFYVPDEHNQNITKTVFAYGDAGDTVLVGDWDGDGKDSLTVRRGNHFFVKNDNQRSGKADSEFHYGDSGDVVHVGNWDGATGSSGKTNDPSTHRDESKLTTDTLMVQRDNKFFVKNDLKTGDAEYTFYFGDAKDKVIVGDWAQYAKPAQGTTAAREVASSDGADQLAVRRGFEYHLSTEIKNAKTADGVKTDHVLHYGDKADTVFVASLKSSVKVDLVIKAEPGITHLSTDGTTNGDIVFDKDGKPLVVTPDGADTGNDLDAAVPAVNTGGAVTAYTRDGKALHIPNGATFTLDGAFLYNKDGVPYVAKDPAAVTPDMSAMTAVELKAAKATATATATPVYDKDGKAIQKTIIIHGDGLGVRR